MNEQTYKNEPLNDAKLYSFMIEVSLLTWLKEEAKEQKISVSRLIRDAVKFYMKFTKAEA